MKKILFSIMSMLFFVSIAAAQRGDVPTENPNNELDLKVVFQEYFKITNDNRGHTRRIEKGEYLYLKVNGLYLKDGNTGIDKGMFKKYLGNCPRALDLGLEGLGNYKSSIRNGRLQWLSILSGVAGAALIGKHYLQEEGERNSLDRNLGIGLLAGGVTTYFYFGHRSNKYEELGDDHIVDAFSLYREDCFTGSEVVSDELENGDFNKEEKVGLDLKTNNVKAAYLAIGPYGAFRLNDDVNFDAGLKLNLGKRGFAAEVKAAKSWTPFFDFDEIFTEQEAQYFAEGNVTVPVLSSIKPRKTVLNMGSANKLEFAGVSNELENLIAFGLDGGLEISKGYSKIMDNRNSYLLNKQVARGGISLSFINEASYKVLDNRFSEKTFKNFTVVKLYAHTLFDLDSEIEIVGQEQIFGFPPDGNPDRPDVGFVIGLEFLSKANGILGRTIKVELGRYPVFNDLSGFGARIELGYNLFSVKR